MKSFLCIILLISFIGNVLSGISWWDQVLDGGNGIENTRVFESWKLRKDNVDQLHSTCQYTFRSYFSSPPTAFKHWFSTIVLATNNDGEVIAFDMDTCIQRHRFNLSDFGGHPGNGDVGGIFASFDFSRSSITIDPLSNMAAICSLGIGLNATCWIYDPTYFGSGTPPLLKTFVVDTDVASIVTSSPKFYREYGFGRLKLLVGTSSRGEFYALNPAFNPPTFKGGLYQFDVLSGKLDWKALGTPKDDPGYTGTSVITQSFPISFRHNTVLFGTNNNYQIPVEVSDCILENGDCSSFDHPENRPDSIIAVDLSTGGIEWSHEYSFAPGDPNGKAPDNWGFECSDDYTGTVPCPEYTGDDEGPLQSPMKITLDIGFKWTEVAVIGTKRGQVAAHDLKTGQQLWLTRTGPGTARAGGHAFGATYDEVREILYYANNNRDNVPWTLIDGTETTGPFITGLDARTGDIVIQKELPGVSYQGCVIQGRMLVCGNRNNDNAPGMYFYDLDNELSLIHEIDTCLSGNNPIFVDGKMILSCGYFGSPETDFSIYVYSV